MSQATADVISDVLVHYDVPDGDSLGTKQQEWTIQNGTERGWNTRLLIFSVAETQSQGFSTKHNLSKAAVDELLEMLSKVCTLHIF